MAKSLWRKQSVHVNGQRIHLQTAGESGPLVLLLHGFPDAWYSWRHQLDVLARAGYRAVAIEMRGYGRSSKPTTASDYRITELIEDCIGVVRALGESTCVIVGHDWGSGVAWTAAWVRPDIFRAVASLSVPFGGRGFVGLPGDPFGDIKPSIAHRALAGPDLQFYQEYFNRPGHVAEREAEDDLRSWVTAFFYTLSADAPLSPDLDGVDLMALPEDKLQDLLRSAVCFPRDAGYRSVLQQPDILPAWLTEEDIDFYVTELEYSGLTGPLNYYRSFDLDWELLGQYQGRPITVPSLFIGGDRDLVTIWSQETIRRMDEVLTDHRGSVILPQCGHWTQQEKPEAVNHELISFLKNL